MTKEQEIAIFGEEAQGIEDVIFKVDKEYYQVRNFMKTGMSILKYEGCYISEDGEIANRWKAVIKLLEEQNEV